MSARGTSTLLNNGLLSAHFRTPDLPEARKIVDAIKAAGANPMPQTKYLKGYEDSTKVRPDH